jgi:hypothetical protein
LQTSPRISSYFLGLEARQEKASHDQRLRFLKIFCNQMQPSKSIKKIAQQLMRDTRCIGKILITMNIDLKQTDNARSQYEVLKSLKTEEKGRLETK